MTINISSISGGVQYRNPFEREDSQFYLIFSYYFCFVKNEYIII
jgi:hypothetical protein